MLTYKKSNHLEVIGYLDSDYASCVDPRKSTFNYMLMLAGGAILWRLNLCNALKPLFMHCG